MANIDKTSIEIGSTEAPSQFYIKIMPDGPYLVYGNPPLDQQLIIPDEAGSSWVYRKGEISFDSVNEPMALCRCGASSKKPFCDGAHKTHDWNPKETAPFEDILTESEIYEGERIFLSDNQRYCAFARFCDAKGRIWSIVQKARSDDEVELAKREAAHCPAGRLMIWDEKTHKPYEPEFSPSLSLLEDPGIKASGPIWVKGGIKIISSNGKCYQIRNRVTICRCGQSENKPFCDGTHASMKFDDGLSQKASKPNSDW